MNLITQYFGKNLKKRDFSDGSKAGGDDSKKPSVGGWESYTDKADIFEECVESANCRKNLFDCLKNWEEKNVGSLHAS